MLATIDPARCSTRLWFPLGEQTKEETRAEAEAAGLAAGRRRAESQEACFLGGDDYRVFLARDGLAARARPLVDESGTVLGSHEGYWRFTPGQRRGLGIAAAEPLYALATDARTNTVVVGPRASLARTAGAGPGPARPCPEPRRGEASAPLARGRRHGRPAERRASSFCSTSPPTGSRAARPPSSTTDGAVVGAGVIVGAAAA